MQRGVRRFYRSTAIAPADGGFAVLLGSRPVRTPAGMLLRLPTAALAAAVANEWLAQPETLRPDTMPLTRLAATALDRIGAQRDAIFEGLMAYVDSDAICYRAAEPDDLVAMQMAVWQPLVEWLADACGARMAICEGVVPLRQSPSTVRALRAALEEYSDWQLAVLGTVVPASGSLILGLAMLRGRLDVEAAIDAALLDERWQARRWGADAEAEARRSEVAEEMRAAALFLSLIHEGRQQLAGGRAA